MNCRVYGVPTVAALKSVALFMVKAELIVSPNVPLAVRARESDTVAVKATEPALGGVPESTPAAFRLSHEGRLDPLQV